MEFRSRWDPQPKGDAGDRAGGVHSSMESTHKIESDGYDNFSHRVKYKLMRRARLIEPAGANSFSKGSGGALSTQTFMHEWLKLASVSSKARLFPHFFFPNPTKPRALGFS